MVRLFLHGALDLKRDDSALFNVNGQHVKHYLGSTEMTKLIKELNLDEV